MLSKLKSLGPGLLYAGAAIGVSHLVQSTKAGAYYGYTLILAIILAHLFKYPFFVLGPRYANQTNTSLISGFARIGKGSLWVVLILTVSTMFAVQSAVTIVTAGLAQNLTSISLGKGSWSLLILIVCFAILQIGKFRVLDHLMKVIMVVLAITTLVAFFFSFGLQTGISTNLVSNFSLNNKKDYDFLISFVGWMPAPLDIAIWHSIWSVSNKKLKSKSLSEENFDFNVGFYGTGILGICFLMLGAHTLYGSGIEVEQSAVGFAAQLAQVFTSSIGPWAHYVVLVAAFTTMFSTTITCLDAMPRVLNEIVESLYPKLPFNRDVIVRGILVGGSSIILLFFVDNMKDMVHFATTISFLTAPILAVLCYQLVQKENASLWSKKENALAIIGIVFLSVLSFGYIFL